MATAAVSEAGKDMDGFDGRRVVIFLAWAFGLGWLVALALWWRGAGLNDGVAVLLQSLMMLTPGGAAAIAILATDRPHALRAGLGLGRCGWWRYWLFGWIVVPSLCLAAPFIGDLLGVFETDMAHFSGFRQLLSAAGPAGAKLLESFPIEVLAGLQLAQALLLGPLLNGLFTLGEEYGWRGFLLPALRPLGHWTALIGSSAIWGLWHAPIILLGHNYPDHPILGVLLMTVFCVIFGILFGWTRLATGSVWPAVIAHGALNASAGAAAVFAKAGTVHDSALAGVTGVTGWILPVVIILVLTAAKRLPVRSADPAS